MNPPNIIEPVVITVRVVNGDPMLDTAAMSLLFGIDEKLITKTLSGGSLKIPKPWIRAGRRRAAEARAHTGNDGMLAALQYWARRDHGADLQIDYL